MEKATLRTTETTLRMDCHLMRLMAASRHASTFMAVLSRVQKHMARRSHWLGTAAGPTYQRMRDLPKKAMIRTAIAVLPITSRATFQKVRRTHAYSPRTYASEYAGQREGKTDVCRIAA